MKSNRLSYTVEAFYTEPSKTGEGRNMVVGGWLHAISPTLSMEIQIPGSNKTWPVPDCFLESAGLIHYFGPLAANKRFHMTAYIGNAKLAFAAATLRVVLTSGDRLIIPIGDLFNAPLQKPLDEVSSLVMRFESLGDNCEFGLLQRQMGTERLGLFRYAGTPRAPALIEGLQNKFHGFATPDDLKFHLLGGEWMAVSRHYGFEFHTHRYQTSMTEDEVRAAESVHLRFLVRLLLEDIEDSPKIFVRRNGRWGNSAPEDGMYALYHALREIGPARLLWVTLADGGHPHGTVIRLEDGLFRGYIDTLSDYADAFRYSAASWITLLREAIRLIDGTSPVDQAGENRQVL
jgi:hypothetical protein